MTQTCAFMSASIASVRLAAERGREPNAEEVLQNGKSAPMWMPQKRLPFSQGKQRLPYSRLCRVAPCRFRLLVGESVIEAHLCQAEQLSFGQAHCGGMLVLG